MWVSFIAGAASAIGLVVQKIFLTRSKISRPLYEVILFLFLFCLSGFLSLIFPQIYWVSDAYKEPYYIILFVILGLVGSAWNILLVKGLTHDKISNNELILMLEPLAVILIATLVLPSERNLEILIVSLIAVLALMAAHIQRHHLSFNNSSKELLAYLLFVGFEAVLIKQLLVVYSPVALYTYRTLLIFLYFAVFFRPFKMPLSARDILGLLGISLIGITSMVSLYYAYQSVGIVTTRLILLISPIIVYACSAILFKERIKGRILVSAIVIFASILYILYRGLI